MSQITMLAVDLAKSSFQAVAALLPGWRPNPNEHMTGMTQFGRALAAPNIKIKINAESGRK